MGEKRELEELIHLVKARRWIAVLGPRMMGKTSLIKVAGAELRKTKTKVIYVNLGVKGTAGLLKAIARGLNDEKGILQEIKDIAQRIEGVSIGPGGISISVAKNP
ncbi:MAG: hypothetical protein QXU81_10305 [Candidatus Bathyarchaeia archaeon]